MIPTIGRIVYYKLNSIDAEKINRRRQDSIDNTWARENKTGAQLHVGSLAKAGDVLPMMIVKTWGANDDSAVNGQVYLDGNDTLWVTSVSVGKGKGNFEWPKIPKAEKLEEPKAEEPKQS